MQSHTGVQVMIVGLARHVGHGERYRCTVGDGHCRGHREKKELNVTAFSDRGLPFPITASRDAQLIAQ